MKNLMIIFAMMFLMVGVISAATFELGNMTIGNLIAGGSTEATFDFNYLDDGSGLMNSSLVLRVNMSSLEDDCPMSDCSVWKGDFSLLGVIKQYTYFWPFEQERIISLHCTENDVVNFSTSRGVLYSQENLEDGTFYCYNKNNYLNTLELDKKDEVTLRLSSHQALYPGSYSMNVELLEVEIDTTYPDMDLILDGFDDFVFGVDDVIPIRISVSDMYNVDYVKYKITNPEIGEGYYEGNWIILEDDGDGLYVDDFDISEHSDLNISGSYYIEAWACDVLGNCGPM